VTTRLARSLTDWHRVRQAGWSAKRCQVLSARLIGRAGLLMPAPARMQCNHHHHHWCQQPSAHPMPAHCDTTTITTTIYDPPPPTTNIDNPVPAPMDVVTQPPPPLLTAMTPVPPHMHVATRPPPPLVSTTQHTHCGVTTTTMTRQH